MHFRLFEEEVNNMIALHRMLSVNYFSGGKQLLKTLFDLYSEIYNYLLASSPAKTYVAIKIDKENFTYIDGMRLETEKFYPLDTHAVFEDNGKIKEITADAWREKTYFGTGNNALIKMRFSANCRKLPLHVHPYSGRILLIIEGNGYGYHLAEHRKEAIEDIQSIEISAGTMLFFMPNVIHSLSTAARTLTTLTYHTPFYEFNDEKSFEKLAHWYPNR